MEDESHRKEHELLDIIKYHYCRDKQQGKQDVITHFF
jgi:hypothetical protein